jgi:hypothetical protein
MADVVCPNCRAVVAALPYCSHCRSPLVFESGLATETTPETIIQDLVVNAAAAIAAPTATLESLEPADIDVLTQMDPRLQRAVVRSRQGIIKLPSSSTDVDEVAVVATVTDPVAWESLSEVRMGATIGTDDSGQTMVTGRIPVSRIEAVRTQPFVTSLKASQRLQPVLDRTIAEIGARRIFVSQMGRRESWRFGTRVVHRALQVLSGLEKCTPETLSMLPLLNPILILRWDTAPLPILLFSAVAMVPT